MIQPVKTKLANPYIFIGSLSNSINTVQPEVIIAGEILAIRGVPLAGSSISWGTPISLTIRIAGRGGTGDQSMLTDIIGGWVARNSMTFWKTR